MTFTGYLINWLLANGLGVKMIISPKFNEFPFQEVLQSETHTVYMSEMTLYLWSASK